MKRALLLVLVAACAPEPPRADPVLIVAEPQETESEPKPEPECECDKPGFICSEGECVPDPDLPSAKDLYAMGRESVALEAQLLELSTVAVAHACMERSTGEDLDGKALVRHLERDTRHARKCKAEISAMSEDEILTQAKELSLTHKNRVK